MLEVGKAYLHDVDDLGNPGRVHDGYLEDELFGLLPPLHRKVVYLQLFQSGLLILRNKYDDVLLVIVKVVKPRQNKS